MNEEIEIKKIEEEIKRKRLLREYEILKAKEAKKLMELPFYLRIQDPSHKERLQKLEKIQEEVMNYIIKKHYPSLKGQEKDLFAEFFTEFLNGEVKSINHFFEKRKMPEKKGIIMDAIDDLEYSRNNWHEKYLKLKNGEEKC